MAVFSDNTRLVVDSGPSYISGTVGIEGNGGPEWFSTTATTSTITTTGNYGTATTGGIYLDTGTTGGFVVSDTSTTITYSVTNGTDGVVYVNFVDKKKMLRDHMKQNLLIRSTSRSLERSFSPEEQRARNSLRDLITEKDWRRYVTNGFIMVKGEHYWYQIFKQGNIQVYHKGKKTHSICIHTDRSCPPTDHVLNMKLLVEIDERQIWRGGNVYNAGNVLSCAGLTINSNRGNLLELAKMYA